LKGSPRNSVRDLILRSGATGSRECAPDGKLRDASRRMAATPGLAAILRGACSGDARAPPLHAPQDEVEAVSRVGGINSFGTMSGNFACKNDEITINAPIDSAIDRTRSENSSEERLFFM
jgi:hypothetical protein